MAKQLMRNSQDICADCGSTEPNWASLNRGILICEECCSIHRSLGRHVSQVKSVKKSVWSATQLQMMYELSRTGANSIWEHTLLDPQTGKSATKSKKPTPKDPLHPNKSEFIRAKHQNLMFINRSTTKEESETDLSEQLHSSVRTPNLKTSLRLLAAGANPNYIHNEKFNSPLHMAAKSNQMSQIELLIIYGANPSIIDVKGKTSIDYAREANATEIAERLIECQYEVSDRLTYFVCGRIPDHRDGQHYLIPEMVINRDNSEFSRSKLQSLSHRLFEELSRDVYDEVDRREIDAIWNASHNQNSQLNNDRHNVPFLPVNPGFSSTRNQGRQKLARFNGKEFAALIIDILCEIRRRLHGLPSPTALCQQKSATTVANTSVKKCFKKQNSESDLSSDYDSEPLYDSVPEEEEHEEDAAKTNRKLSAKQSSEKSNTLTKSIEKQVLPKSVSIDEYVNLKEQLCRSDSLIQELVGGNKEMRYEITRLQIMVQKLIDENAQLRAVVIPKSVTTNCNIDMNYETPPPVILPRSQNRITATRPQSMYEKANQTAAHTAHTSSSLTNLQQNSFISLQCPSVTTSHQNENNNQISVKFVENDENSCSDSNSFIIKTSPCFPMKEELLVKTEQITRRIQDLLTAAKENRHEEFESCSDRINSAVTEMINIFPESFMELSSCSNGDQIYLALSQLHNSALRLRIECNATINISNILKQQDFRVVYQQVIQCAFDIAKAAKQLVTLFQ